LDDAVGRGGLDCDGCVVSDAALFVSLLSVEPEPDDADLSFPPLLESFVDAPAVAAAACCFALCLVLCRRVLDSPLEGEDIFFATSFSLQRGAKGTLITLWATSSSAPVPG